MDNANLTLTEEIMLSLPEVPDNQYWDIEKGPLSMDFVILRQRGRFWDKKIDSRILSFRYSDTREIIPPHLAIRYGAESIMEEINGSKAWEPFYGTYVKA